MAIETTNKLTGAWKKKSKFGEFFTSPNVPKAEVLAALERCKGDSVQFVLQPVAKLSENSPDYNIKITDGYVKQ